MKKCLKNIIVISARRISREELFERYPSEAGFAQREAWRFELAKEHADEIDDRIREALNGEKIWALIGGPPCQAYSVVGRVRMCGCDREKYENDPRHYFYPGISSNPRDTPTSGVCDGKRSQPTCHRRQMERASSRESSVIFRYPEAGATKADTDCILSGGVPGKPDIVILSFMLKNMVYRDGGTGYDNEVFAVTYALSRNRLILNKASAPCVMPSRIYPGFVADFQRSRTRMLNGQEL